LFSKQALQLNLLLLLNLKEDSLKPFDSKTNPKFRNFQLVLQACHLKKSP